MSIQYIKEDILKTDTTVIAYQVNCMGNIEDALVERMVYKYPDVYDRYRDTCASYPQFNILGQTLLSKTLDNRIIANCFAQIKSGCGVQTNYDALRKCLETLEKFAKRNKFSVAIPYKIGCGLAGGNWEVVKKIIEEIYTNSPVTLKIHNCEG